MDRHIRRPARFAAAGTSILLAAVPTIASAQYTDQNRDVFAANTGVWSAGGVTLNSTNFIVQGLQGVGRVSASSTQSFGTLTETLGSISDMQITNWAYNAGAGQYSGVFNLLPDRGYNAGSTFSNYAARLNTFDFTFTPYTSNAITVQQNQIQLTYTGSTRFTYDHDGISNTAPILTTGLVANSAATSFLSQPVPTVTSPTTIGADGPIANRLTLDSEGLILDPRAGKEGEGWMGDEYGAFIYHFNASKEIDGIVTIPAALVPHRPAGTTYFTDSPANVDGRRVNQGMEGIAISPDGTRLFAMLQSATIQDSASGNQGRTVTRVLVYDTSGGAEVPTDPIEQYVVQLPRFDSDLNGSLDRAGAQSGILAISNHELLILSRDGNGRGVNGPSPVFKSVLLADLSTGDNIDGTYDAAGARVTSGTGADVELLNTITAVEWTESLNMLGKLDLGVTELEQFSLNLLANDGDMNTISEKWEGMALVPTLDGNPYDYFLFLGNDNDFQTTTGFLTQADGSTLAYDAGLNNDTMILAWRVSIQPVPVPAAVWLMGSALAGLYGVRRRRTA
jgi:hypothetical protein